MTEQDKTVTELTELFKEHLEQMRKATIPDEAEEAARALEGVLFEAPTPRTVKTALIAQVLRNFRDLAVSKAEIDVLEEVAVQISWRCHFWERERDAWSKATNDPEMIPLDLKGKISAVVAIEAMLKDMMISKRLKA